MGNPLQGWHSQVLFDALPQTHSHRTEQPNCSIPIIIFGRYVPLSLSHWLITSLIQICHHIKISPGGFGPIRDVGGGLEVSECLQWGEGGMDREVGVDAPGECGKLRAWVALSLIAFFLALAMVKMWYKLFIYNLPKVIFGSPVNWHSRDLHSHCPQVVATKWTAP